MASSHSGEDLHVRTLQALYRRAGVSQTRPRLRCRGHAARRADGGPTRSRRRAPSARSATCAPASTRSSCCCAGSTAGSSTTYWLDDHPAQAAYREVVARAFGTTPERLHARHRRLRRPDLRLPAARGRPGLRDPGRPGSRARDRRPRALAPALTIVRDAMLAHPEMVGGTRERLDTSLMKALAGPGREQGRDGGAARHRDPAPGARTGTSARAIRDGRQDRGRRRVRARDLGRVGRGAPPGRRARRPRRSAARPLPPTGDPRPARAARRRDRSPTSSSPRSASSSAEANRRRSVRSSTRPSIDDAARPATHIATLGLASPARSLDEVKRAYRRLAKRYHPDAAGRAGARRFLAIHVAYEQLIGPARLDGGRRSTSRRRPGRGRRTRAGPSDPPTRMRPTRPGVARRRRPGRRPRRAAGTGGDRPARDGWLGRRVGQPERGRAGAVPGGRPAGPAGPGDAPARRGAGPGRSAPARGRAAAAAPGRCHRTTAVRRAGKRNKATLDSTSYDEADDPFEPGWGGASWYGPSSGTYWTINPKEYADPRKHGPEYQARAGARGGRSLDARPTTRCARPAGAAPDGQPASRAPARRRFGTAGRAGRRQLGQARRPIRWAGGWTTPDRRRRLHRLRPRPLAARELRARRRGPSRVTAMPPDRPADGRRTWRPAAPGPPVPPVPSCASRRHQPADSCWRASPGRRRLAIAAIGGDRLRSLRRSCGELSSPEPGSSSSALLGSASLCRGAVVAARGTVATDRRRVAAAIVLSAGGWLPSGPTRASPSCVR